MSQSSPPRGCRSVYAPFLQGFLFDWPHLKSFDHRRAIYASMSFTMYLIRSLIFWSSLELALFDEESWQSSRWPWVYLSDRVMGLFWATRRSLLTGSHQKSLNSRQALKVSKRHLSGFKLRNHSFQNPRGFQNVRGKFQSMTAFSAGFWLMCNHWKLPQSNGVESKRFRVRVENSQICLCEASKACDRGSPKPPISPPSQVGKGVLWKKHP